ncbi:hypothetical protein CFP56_013967 [Quercus suber]|uniref:Uncharacterized protein n=1 Tax=Quercus suber TaxID=58331 RepID=A0AAW0KVJ5_QUESU
MNIIVWHSLRLERTAFHNRVLGARYLKEEDSLKNPQVSSSGSSKNEVESSFATVERTVPSCPDPLHNSLNMTPALCKPEMQETMPPNHTSLKRHHSEHQKR